MKHARPGSLIASLTLLTLAAVGLHLAGCAQSVPTLDLTGTVTDSLTGRPVFGAKVSDDGYGSQPPRSAMTDSLGAYSYKTWPEEHNILVTARGYKSRRETLFTSFFGNETTRVLNFILAPE
jgi:hypothetical protein